MSGAEAAFVFGLISGVISICQATQAIYEAAKDAKGQPEAFCQVHARLVLVIAVLDKTKERAKKVDETSLEALEPILESCKAKVENLHKIFQKVIRKDNDKWYGRYKRAVGTLGKGQRVESLMAGILEDIQVLACDKLTEVATEAQAKEIVEAIKQMNEMPSSLRDETGGAVTQNHEGSGSNYANTAGGFWNSGSGNLTQNDIKGDAHFVHAINPIYNSFVPAQRKPEPSSNAPFQRDSVFVGREDILVKIMAKLEKASSQDHARVALVGLGGVGKTQIAIEYAYRLRVSSPQTWVFWVHASSVARIQQEFTKIAAMIELPGRDEPKADIFRLVYNWLCDKRNGRWLLILDNVFGSTTAKSDGVAQGTDGAAMTLASIVPQSANGWILVTSRDRLAAINLVGAANVTDVGLPEQWSQDTSDVESVASDFSTISSASTASSQFSVNSIMESLVFSATKMLSITLCTDNDLAPIYQHVLLKIPRERFVRNFDRMLKRLFIDLKPELSSKEQRYAVRTLRASSVRKLVSEYVYTTISTEKESGTPEKSQKHLPSGPLASAEDVELSESESNSDYDIDDIENLDEPTREENVVSKEELQELIDSLVDTRAFRIFKENFQIFANPHPTIASATIERALSRRDLPLLEFLLQNKFEEVAQGDFSWLHEVDLLGYTRVEIADLLFEDATDSPWIFFGPSSLIPKEMKLDFHLPNCAHTVLQADVKSTTLSTLASLQFETMDFVNLSTARDTESIIQQVSGFCGLAGIVPSSRNLSTWIGQVVFEHEKTTSRVIYGASDEINTDLYVVRCCVRALQGLSKAIGYFQQVSCCCDSFTILKSLEHENAKTVQVVQIRFELVDQLHSNLLEILRYPINTSNTSSFQRCTVIAAKILFTLGIPYSTEAEGLLAEDYQIDGRGDTIHSFCLAVQTLCLGFLAYSQAHCGSLQPFFLDTAQQKVLLQGSKLDPGSSWQLQVQLVNLTCIGDMLDNSVLVFSAFKEDSKWLIPPTDYALNLLTSPQDLLDTWGPGNFVCLEPETESGVFCAIGIRGGTIKAADCENGMLHWSRNTVCDTGPKSRFKAEDMLLIGGSVAIKHDCPSNKHHLWEKAGEEMSSLGTFKDYWMNAERQIGFQGGEYVSFVFQNVWAKVPGKSLKDFQLDQEPLNYYFLRCKWELQISCCTGVGRRVPLCDLLADVMPDFVESLLPVPPLWEKLKQDFGIIQAFSGPNLQQWLGNLDEACQRLALRITRWILSLLRHTGIDHKGENLTVSWPQKENPFQCLKLKCDKQNYWTRILADSDDCATFAYITPKCLETTHLKCRGLVPNWRGSSALLDTAVCRHITSQDFAGNTIVEWTLKDKETYCMGKPDFMLTIRVERPNPNAIPRLYVSPSLIPKSIIRRMFHSEKARKSLKSQKLRERQWIGGQSEHVLVLGRD